MSRGKILVIRGGAIGDFILTLPVLSALRSSFPEARVELLGYPHIAKLATLGKLAHDVRSIEAQALAGFFARNGSVSDDLAAYFCSFDIIISYLYDPDAIFQTNVVRCSKAQFIQGPHRPNEAENVHATDVFLKPLERLAIFDADPVPKLTIGGQQRASSIRIGVHPGSGSEKKNWPEANWLTFLRMFTQTHDESVLMIGGEAEGEKVHRLAKQLPTARVEVVYNLPLLDLAERFANCSLFLGHDSGISHLAAAVGLPGIVLWGESNEVIWRPRSDSFKALRAQQGLQNLSAEVVLQAVDSALQQR